MPIIFLVICSMYLGDKYSSDIGWGMFWFGCFLLSAIRCKNI